MIPGERRGGVGMYDSDEDDDEADYDLSPDEDELDDEDEEDESDELDDLDDPRIEELVTDEEEATPQLVKSKAADNKKGKNKRVAEDESINEPANLDDIMAKSLKPADATAANGEQKLSKKQLKKLKNNAGNAVAAANTDAKKENAKNDDASSKDKKVQFAKELEQGPTGSSPAGKDAKDTKADPNQPSIGVKVVQGVTVDDKKLGSGPVAKKGNKVEMRYIGKLQSNGLQFDGTSHCPSHRPVNHRRQTDTSDPQPTRAALRSRSSSASARSSRDGTSALRACRPEASGGSPSPRTWLTARGRRDRSPPTARWCLT